LETDSGVAFVTEFNRFYYSFSPTIADWERQDPALKQVMRLTLEPMLWTLSLLNYVEISSNQQMLGYGIGIILLNMGIYFVAPTMIIVKVGSYLKARK
jgi:hypothetical protein